jgi:putative Mn2+ efflux pump MntP
MAVATSIDALAIGITFVAVPVSVVGDNIWINTMFGCLVIAVITFIISAIGVYIGNIFGAKYKSGAEAVGGIVLILIGIKIIVQYLMSLFGFLM